MLPTTAILCAFTTPIAVPVRPHRVQMAAIQMIQTISVGANIPDVEVEVATADRNVAARKKLVDVLGEGTTILLGMPGAFTPTCTDQHLPGFYKHAKEFADLGVESISVVTANDRFVNVAWQKEAETCLSGCAPDGERWTSSPVQMIADPRGDLLEEMGMIAYLGQSLGIRSKRFALVLRNGVIQHVAIDEGSEALVHTSAEALLDVIGAIEKERRRIQAECVASAELYKMSAAEAQAYLASAETQAALIAEGVPEETITESLAIVTQAMATGGAPTASLAGGNSEDSSTRALVGGVAGVLIGLLVAQQQGVFDVSTMVDAASAVDAAIAAAN